MGNVCKKCGYERQPLDTAPEYECPKCRAIYAKVDEYLEKKKIEEERQKKQLEAKKEKELQEQYACTDCGYFGNPIIITRGNFFIELISWLAFIIPGIIYSVWRLTSKYKACPQCKHESMIPATSPKGRKIMAESGIQ